MPGGLEALRLSWLSTPMASNGANSLPFELDALACCAESAADGCKSEAGGLPGAAPAAGLEVLEDAAGLGTMLGRDWDEPKGKRGRRYWRVAGQRPVLLGLGSVSSWARLPSGLSASVSSGSGLNACTALLKMFGNFLDCSAGFAVSNTSPAFSFTACNRAARRLGRL